MSGELRLLVGTEHGLTKRDLMVLGSEDGWAFDIISVVLTDDLAAAVGVVTDHVGRGSR